MNNVANKNEQEFLTMPQRAGELLLVFGMGLLFTFFVVHQIFSTGFFTSKFGTFEIVCLYVPIGIASLAPLVRAITGQRNPARPIEALGSLCLAFGSLWLLIVFPFDYSHLADVLPNALRFLLAWITDNIARIVFVLQIIVAFISAIVLMWQFFARRAQMTYAPGH